MDFAEVICPSRILKKYIDGPKEVKRMKDFIQLMEKSVDDEMFITRNTIQRSPR
jgi:hypothetical protein